MSERSDDPKPGFCFGRKATVAEREPTPAPSDATLPLRRMLKKAVDLYSPSDGEVRFDKLMGFSYTVKTEPPPREFLYVGRYISPGGSQYSILDPDPYQEGGDKIRLIEYSAFEQLQRELKATDECAHRWQTAFGEAQEANEKLQRECDAFRAYFDDKEQHQTFGHVINENARLQAALEAMESRLNFECERLEMLEKELTAARAREAKLREALWQIDRLVLSTEVTRIIREALKEIEDE